MSNSSSKQHQGHFARKRFGQNFLVDLGIIDSIVDVIRPQRGERMVEIGPGLGALTEPLIGRLATPEAPLHAVELDRDLIGRLKKKFGELLELHEGDALAFDFGALAAAGEKPTLRIVGNLPYNISSPLLFHLVTFADRVIDQHFMLQNEVVERMVAEPGTKAFSRLSVMLQYRYVIDKLLDVPPESFQPPPKVDSAIVRMIPYAPHELPSVDQKTLGELVTAAFSQRRKMLRNTLSAYRDTVDFEALGFDLQRRAEDVPVAEYVSVAQAVSAASPK
ncbi:16S rRNA (adenine(1518)-N(6)/adenine(1519)-N(6))-dimethyltransferase RsmA [Paraburkholderia hospita]|jgi:16S rRNA (adenine1518-N6/adenine1519-N6)-dimethyltransferase|uniref:16S rRNA (adenine(1518)-N(6)/adenine(1519)-N(6))- dimethyltransferase RsmA n=1 Tax=Paraburkholderia hospita TaxID=169430 RepID=UPI0002719D5F|nr:16S rRNA (adenine(1518)-N(6)/adenine(1519)-N(6))-dimethyltransferase RsmA [Paraburkholderia hospita]EUC16772.1 Ribosomal RNA small subunit methyltransferase A [Burkholderia sp. BT03]SKC69103.1 dimethyladenosine transferase [Burkholderia sp. CF099]SOE57284.1 dimethyladenosine transferase [Burkholderia sp. YR290]AXE97396.1 16S rRNA (adenine(1518)-N(6)/adenine(1519)-N(6))-dimethyltransferase RsmA [Paraburkholderia hospita]OUL87507.1 16S rRNA (adenine(1518)-N(6)/adenine(1519)-N(6))-dimethyltran